MATEDNLEELRDRLRDDDYRKIVAENERLKVKCMLLERESLHFEFDVDGAIHWIEEHYLFCIVVLLALSYLGGFIVEAIETRRKFNGRGREGWS